jgi:OOP family OmpA-OmpF porin
MMSLFLISCASQKPARTFDTTDLGPLLRDPTYVQKVDNFLVILDATASMRNGDPSRLCQAKDLVHLMNQTIPNLKLNAGLRTLGTTFFPFGNKTRLVYGVTEYTRAGLEEGLNTVGRANGRSPLQIAIDAANEDLASMPGDIAVIIVSDGEDMGDPVVASAQNMKSQFGDRVCIYTIAMGGGRALLERVAQAGQCGFATTASAVSSKEGMADFVEKVFFERGGCPDSDGDGVCDRNDRCPNTPKGVAVDQFGCPLDTDGDGVPDYLDKCPGTPKGATVNEVGCWILKGVHFDTDKSIIKPQFYPILDEVLLVLEKNPSLRVRIEGHTDNVGTPKYNQRLSERRAKAVMDYFIDKGMAPARLQAAGYGLTQPMASNETPEGRAKNRRVRLMPLP